jgi:hypothetical protein
MGKIFNEGLPVAPTVDIGLCLTADTDRAQLWWREETLGPRGQSVVL